jgi:hypothetical protein
MSKRLDKIASIISYITEIDNGRATFGDVDAEFDNYNYVHSTIRPDRRKHGVNITKEEYQKAYKLLQKKSYRGKYPT